MPSRDTVNGPLPVSNTTLSRPGSSRSTTTAPAASVACPHNGTSTVGVNQRSRYRPSDDTTKAVSARLFSAATACSRASSRKRSSTTTAAGLPVKRRVAKASSWKIGTRMAAWYGRDIPFARRAA